MHWFSIRPGHAGSLSSLLADNNVELYRFTFAHALLDLMRAVPSDRCQVDKDVLADVMIDGAVSVLDVKSFDATMHVSISVTAQVALCQVEMSVGLPALIQGVLIR